MKTYILIYEGFAQFEVVLASYFLKTKGEIITVGINKNSVVSGEGFITTPHVSIDEVLQDDIDLFIIPGGDPKIITDNKFLYELLRELFKNNKKIGAICSGTIHLAKSGILENNKFTTSLSIDENRFFNKENFVNENVVIDNTIITAKGNGYVDFAIKLGAVMNIYENDADYEETINYFKNFIE